MYSLYISDTVYIVVKFVLRQMAPHNKDELQDVAINSEIAYYNYIPVYFNSYSKVN